MTKIKQKVLMNFENDPFLSQQNIKSWQPINAILMSLSFSIDLYENHNNCHHLSQISIWLLFIFIIINIYHY